MSPNRRVVGSGLLMVFGGCRAGPGQWLGRPARHRVVRYYGLRASAHTASTAAPGEGGIVITAGAGYCCTFFLRSRFQSASGTSGVLEPGSRPKAPTPNWRLSKFIPPRHAQLRRDSPTYKSGLSRERARDGSGMPAEPEGREPA